MRASAVFAALIAFPAATAAGQGPVPLPVPSRPGAFVCADSIRREAAELTPGSVAARRYAAELWGQAATQCRLDGDELIAGALHLQSSRFFKAAGDRDAAFEQFSTAVGIAYSRTAMGANYVPPGTIPDASGAWSVQTQRWLREAVDADAVGVQDMFGGGTTVRVTIRTEPSGQIVRYWALTDGPGAVTNVTTVDSIRVTPRMYYFVRRRPSGVEDTLARICNVSCVVAFPSSP